MRKSFVAVRRVLCMLNAVLRNIEEVNMTTWNLVLHPAKYHILSQGF